MIFPRPLKKQPPPPAEPPTARAFLPRRRRTLGHLARLRQAEARLHAALVEDPASDDAATHAALRHIRDESQPR